MDQETALELVREKITAEQILRFDDIFKYLHKTTLHQKVGGRYDRILRIIGNVKKIEVEDILNFAHALQVQEEVLTKLIFNQIREAKPAKKAAKGRQTANRRKK